MAKNRTPESEEAKLKNKLSSKRAGQSDVKADPAFRALRKRLKREQRKRRSVTLRQKHAAGKKGAPATAST